MPALPGAEFLLASVTSRKPMHRVRLAGASSRKLGCSNDSQDDMVFPYAVAPFVTRRKDLTRFARPGPALPCPTQPRPPHPGPRSLRRTIAPLLGPGWRMDTAIPNFGKVEYFYARGLTEAWVFCPTGRGPLADAGRSRMLCRMQPHRQWAPSPLGGGGLGEGVSARRDRGRVQRLCETKIRLAAARPAVNRHSPAARRTARPTGAGAGTARG